MKAGTKDASHPLIKEANGKIRGLQIERRELWEPLKTARKNADKKIDKKSFNDSFRITTNELQQVKKVTKLTN